MDGLIHDDAGGDSLIVEDGGEIRVHGTLSIEGGSLVIDGEPLEAIPDVRPGDTAGLVKSLNAALAVLRKLGVVSE